MVKSTDGRLALMKAAGIVKDGNGGEAAEVQAADEEEEANREERDKKAFCSSGVNRMRGC